jgi:hypothetical protein
MVKYNIKINEDNNLNKERVNTGHMVNAGHRTLSF